MNKRTGILILVLGLMLALSGCFCDHDWTQASCTAPKTCTQCEKTEGEALGHDWAEATCTAAKTCSRCGITEGSALGHAWQEATCTEAKFCTRCNLIGEEALGHDWQDATTEAPQTCSRCGLTEGDRIVTDPRFHTAAVSDFLGKWTCQLELKAEDLGLSDLDGKLKFVLALDFGPAGDLGVGFEIADEKAFLDGLIALSMERMYAEFTAQGIDRETADSAMMAAYGMGVEEYIRSSMESISINEILNSIYSSLGLGGVYYVEGGLLYTGSDWDAEMESSAYTFAEGSLTIDKFSQGLGFTAHFYPVAP